MSSRSPLPRVLLLVSTAFLVGLFSSCGDDASQQREARQTLPLCFVTGETLKARGCPVVKADMSVEPDPRPLWHSIECARTSRHEPFKNGGDWHRTASGDEPAERAFRRLTVIDGDRFSGERCELGRNSHLAGDPTFQLYREGTRRVTFASYRVGRDFPLKTDKFQVIMQMKQTQPSNAGGGSPVLSLQVRRGRWELEHVDRRGRPTRLWSAPVEPGMWTRFALDVEYSRSASRGSVRLFADTNGDGLAIGARERSGRFALATMRRETSGGNDDGIEAGRSIPSHLRVGIYHFPAIACPRRHGGCSVDIDNIEVVDPAGILP